MDAISQQLATLEMGFMEYNVFLPPDLSGPWFATSLLHSESLKEGSGGGERKANKKADWLCPSPCTNIWEEKGHFKSSDKKKG